jgi:integrase
VAGKLNAQRAKTAPPGIYPDGEGLYLCVAPSLRRSWVYRYSWKGRRPEMGLGSFDEGVTLADARDARDAWRAVLRSGRNPVDVKRERDRQEAGKRTFGEIADALLEAKASEWRNPKHRDQWRISLVEIAAPLRALPVDAIATEDVLRVLTPLWLERQETASRTRGRIEAVLNAAGAQGLRSGDNPARWKGHLEHLLPKRPKLSRGHFAAMSYSDVPAFMARLRTVDTVAGWALEFAILTAARSGETYGAAWPEIDLEAAVWTIPAARMKAARVHRIPLSDPALAVLKKAKPLRMGELVFPGHRRGKPLSHVAMAKVIERLGVEGATVHGFRSAFRDWAGNETNHPREIAEAALAHVVGDAAEQAYRRGDALEKRRALMKDWGKYCAG